MTNDDDVDVEAQFYDELAGAFGSLEARYRDAACLLRVARGSARPGELEDLRAQLRKLTRRVIEAAGVAEVLLEEKGSGVK